MDPVFTIPYSEYIVAEKLAAAFPRGEGYSLYVPISRQEKGVDLVLTHRQDSSSRVCTIQVKGSRTYPPRPVKRATTKEPFDFNLWFNRLEVGSFADLWILVGLHAPEDGRTRKAHHSQWAPVILCFSADEMRELMGSVRLKSGQPDSKFGIGFNSPDQIFLTRGNEDGLDRDVSKHLLSSSRDRILGCFK